MSTLVEAAGMACKLQGYSCLGKTRLSVRRVPRFLDRAFSRAWHSEVLTFLLSPNTGQSNGV